MAEKPILFNTEMVRAILDGRKTQTRRLVKPSHRGAAGFNVCFRKLTGEFTGVYDWDDEGSMYDDRTPAPCQLGDVLWVRETWQRLFDHRGWRYEYKADHNDDEPLRLGGMYIAWRPSIHMPREAARLFLMVKDVRIERLQDMKMSDIQAEGVVPSDVIGGQWQQWQRNYMKPVWDNTIKPVDLPCYGWDANPWVWVIEFERLDGKPAGLWADRDTAQFGDQDVLMPAT